MIDELSGWVDILLLGFRKTGARPRPPRNFICPFEWDTGYKSDFEKDTKISNFVNIFQ